MQAKRKSLDFEYVLSVYFKELKILAFTLLRRGRQPWWLATLRREHPMESNILIARQEIDLEKILLFVRMNARHVRFLVAPALVDQLLQRLTQFVEQNPGNLVVEVVKPEGETFVLFAVGGALLGGGAGFLLAGIPGAVLGLGVGACAGMLASHLRLTLEFRDHDGFASLTFA